MNKLLRTVLFLTAFLSANASAFAYPDFLEAYQKDPYSKMKDANCAFCHMSPSGGDERNPFGKAFEAAQTKFTPMLRAQFPDRFAYPIVKVSDTLTIHFSDPDRKVVVVESGGTRALVDVDKRTVDGKEATVPGGIAAAQPVARSGSSEGLNLQQSFQTAQVPVQDATREGPFFVHSVASLTDGKRPVQENRRLPNWSPVSRKNLQKGTPRSPVRF